MDGFSEIRSEVGLTLPAVVARGEAGFPAEELCEMTGVGVANIEGDVYHALLRFAQQSSREIYP